MDERGNEDKQLALSLFARRRQNNAWDDELENAYLWKWTSVQYRNEHEMKTVQEMGRCNRSPLKIFITFRNGRKRKTILALISQ